jgi:DNA topoisomerase IB
VPARLKRVDCSEPGIERRRRGRGFEYFDEGGKKVKDSEVLERIGELVIPPAWEDVWICPFPMGHIQATGIDARGRKQYMYHRKWRERRDQEKFDAMVKFARCLPQLRTTVRRDLNRKELDQRRVLACAVRMLDRGFFRIGGEDYAESNDSYGLATMLKEHVELSDGNRIEFDFPAKSGQRHERTVVDPEVYEVVKQLKRRRGGGDELLAYKVKNRWTDVRSEDINGYIKAVAGDDFSAKAFRTWNATVLAALALAVSGPAAMKSKTARKRAVTRAVKEVSYYLGNTPTVARASYIDPRIFDRFDSGLTISGVLHELGGEPDLASIHGRVEHAVLDLIAEDEESPHVEPVEELEELAAA